MAAAHPHKAPSRASIDTAQDELANLQYKLGRAQVAAMLSAGQAKADKVALADLEKLVQDKRAEVEAMVEKFTNPLTPDPAIALAAIREKIEGVAAKAPADPELPAGIVESRKAYLVGEQSGESIAPASSAPKRLQDPESLDWGNDTVADKGTAVAGVAYVTRTGDIVGEIRTTQAGDVLVGDGSGKIEPEYVGLDLATKPNQHVQAIDLPFVTTVDQVVALAKEESQQKGMSGVVRPRRSLFGWDR